MSFYKSPAETLVNISFLHISIIFPEFYSVIVNLQCHLYTAGGQGINCVVMIDKF